jgi:hypothetical protein
MRMRGLSFRRWAAVSTAGALLLSLAVPVTSAAAATTTTVTVPATQPWTDTGISLPAGTVSFKASGTINVAGGDPDGSNTPNGDGPANPTCVAGPSEYSGSWTAPGLPCWALIGRVGNGTPFFIGDSANLDIKTPGELYLGVNDETGQFGDNSGSWTVQVTPESSAPSPTCDAAAYHTVVTQHAGVPDIPELFTEKLAFTWCADSGSQPQIFSSSQSSDVEESGFSLSGILLELYKTAGLSFGVTPATAPDPTIDRGATSAFVTASGLSFNQTINLGQDLVALIPSGLLARAGLKLLPLLRSGQLIRLSSQLRAVWSAAVATIAAALARNFGLPQWVGKLLADFGLGKLVDAVKGYGEQFAAQATTSLEALGRHPALTNIVNALESAVKTVASALTFTKELWGPQITVTVVGGQHPSVNDRASYVDLWINVQALHLTTTPAS